MVEDAPGEHQHAHLDRFEPSAEDLLELVGDGIISTDEAGQIMLFNPAAEKIFGYSREEMIGRPVELLIPQRFRASHRAEVSGYAGSSGNARLMGHRREVVGRRRSGEEFPLEATLSRRSIGERVVLTVVVRDITERHLVEEERRLLTAELAHRMKNTMAVVSSIVALTARDTLSVEAYQKALQGRLAAISRAHDVLIRGAWTGTALKDLLEAELAPFRDQKRRNVLLDGPLVVIPSKVSMTLAMAIHELATNAAKYGGLSRPEGRVTVAWMLEGEGSASRLVLDWQEAGGPAVTPPKKRGFGSEVIERSIARAASGEVRLDYRPEGLRCHIVLPLQFAELPTRRPS